MLITEEVERHHSEEVNLNISFYKLFFFCLSSAPNMLANFQRRGDIPYPN